MKYVGLHDNNKDIVTKEKLDSVEAAIPTKTSQLDNDSGFITSSQAPVQSVNNKTGAVTLSASDVGAQPTITVNGIIKSDGAGNLSVAELNPSSVGLGNVDNVKQYSATNPPPYPVTSVNGKTGAVSVNVPSASSTTPKAPGTASAGSESAYARGDHVHPKQAVTKSDVGLGNVDNVSINTRLNRTTNVNAADSNYTTYMARGIALSATEQTPSVNGAICLVYG